MSKLPGSLQFNPGNYTITVLTQPLSEFQKSWGQRGVLPTAFWDVSTRTIHLRLDRRPVLRFLDFKHEVSHAFIDYLDEQFPDPREREGVKLATGFSSKTPNDPRRSSEGD